MRNFSKTTLEELAKIIMLEIEEDGLKQLSEEFNVILEEMKVVEDIDTEDVEPMDYPYDIKTYYMRDDEEYEVEDQASILANAPEVEGDYIVINKVVG